MSSIRGIVKDIIIVATCVAVIWIGLTAYFGAQNPFYVVSSGSMYPELAMHDIIVISGHAPFEDVRIGDIIVFDRPKDHDKVIVHRVVAYVDDDPLTLRTKGDNNQNSIVGTDYPITEEEYKGTVIHVIPQVGYITKILQPPINYIIIAVIIGIMIIRQIAKNKKALTEQIKTESEIKDYGESQPNEKMDGDLSWLDNYKNASKDFTTQEKKSTEKPEENTKSEGIPEFFLDREKESEEKK
uniref:Peptidase S26B, signal peptidase (SEC11, sipW) n=3 Tax=root TaxID=1 RepID=A0A075GFS2_9ARCH|nr:peptidase S26B, signal peptidase (SEC11, sipW) [uncultured marine thaumarchaeote KM3_06_B11]AIF02065.1 peptidase S26B, signal peptidase (SEC11, sipW) [uncultured marine thaumarchaeote KM3_153_E08]